MFTDLDLKLLRVSRDLRQLDVARAAGVSRQRYAEIERRRHVANHVAERFATAVARAADER